MLIGPGASPTSLVNGGNTVSAARGVTAAYTAQKGQSQVQSVAETDQVSTKAVSQPKAPSRKNMVRLEFKVEVVFGEDPTDFK
jgi:hypothetical protein